MSTDTLEFPPIDAAAPAPSAVAAVAALQPDLAKLDLQAVALAQFSTAHAEAATAKKTLSDVVHDLSTPTKLADAKSLRHRLIGQPLAEARKVSAGLKSKLTAVSKAVGAELAAIETAFDEADALIKPQIEKREAELAEERRLAAEKEAARVQAHRDNLAKLAGYAEHARGLPASRIADGIAKVSAIVIDPEVWQDFTKQAEEQKAVTLERMQKLHADAVADEERERIAAELKAEQERLAAERAEIERQRAELAAQQQAAAEAKAREEAAQALRDAEAARIASEAAKAAAPGFKARKPLPEGVIAGATVNDSGQWYAADGTFMNPDGTRNIFDDVDEVSEIEVAQQAKTNTPEQGTQQVLKAEAPAPDATDRDAPASTSPSVGSMGAGQPADAGPAQGVGAAPAAIEPHMLKLGELWDILGLTDREAFLAGLGFPATPAAKGTGKLYLQSAVPSICLAIADHFTKLAGGKQAA